MLVLTCIPRTTSTYEPSNSLRPGRGTRGSGRTGLGYVPPPNHPNLLILTHTPPDIPSTRQLLCPTARINAPSIHYHDHRYHYYHTILLLPTLHSDVTFDARLKISHVLNAWLLWPLGRALDWFHTCFSTFSLCEAITWSILTESCIFFIPLSYNLEFPHLQPPLSGTDGQTKDR